MFLFTAMPVLTTAYVPLILLQWFTLTCYISFSVHKHLKRYYFFYKNLFTPWLIQPPSLHLIIHLVLWYDYIILPIADLYQYSLCIRFVSCMYGFFTFFLSSFFTVHLDSLQSHIYVIVCGSVFLLLWLLTGRSTLVHAELDAHPFSMIFENSGALKYTHFNWPSKNSQLDKLW